MAAPSGRRAIVEHGDMTFDELELVARTFRVLGDETRLRIFELLQHGEYNQAELVRELGLTQSRVSEHLTCLEWCGFVEETRIDGRRRYFRAVRGRPAKLVTMARAHVEENDAGIASCRRVS